jgi:hypothetical protein
VKTLKRALKRLFTPGKALKRPVKQPFHPENVPKQLFHPEYRGMGRPMRV